LDFPPARSLPPSTCSFRPYAQRAPLSSMRKARTQSYALFSPVSFSPISATPFFPMLSTIRQFFMSEYVPSPLLPSVPIHPFTLWISRTFLEPWGSTFSVPGCPLPFLEVLEISLHSRAPPEKRPTKRPLDCEWGFFPEEGFSLQGAGSVGLRNQPFLFRLPFLNGFFLFPFLSLSACVT